MRSDGAVNALLSVRENVFTLNKTCKKTALYPHETCGEVNRRHHNYLKNYVYYLNINFCLNCDHRTASYHRLDT